MNGIITLLTDFGGRDPFVGVMKGVMLRRSRDLVLVDLSHEIEPQNVAQACFWISRSFRWFAQGTVHLVVVDPGVGSSRAALVAAAAGHYFVAPDNGVLSAVLGAAPEAEARVIELDRHALHQPSSTFHGRDVFAPIAAELAAGKLAFSDVGPPARPVLLALPEPRQVEDGWIGEVLVTDQFGNLLTNLRGEHVIDSVVELGGLRLPIARSYSDVTEGAYLALINAWGELEIARRDADAARGLGLGPGAAVRARRVAR